jgi:phosphoribosyl-ATP pyrophosphohydrolase
VSGSDGDRSGVIKESADLLYHLNVLWADMGIHPDDVWKELRSRESTSGIAEKQNRESE